MNQLTLPQILAVWTLPVLFAITVHEVAHGWIASKLGDQTAKMMGRLTLNPLKHIDLIGTIVVPLLMLMLSGFIFGWAKPVPVTWQNLKHPKRDMAFVAAAGPLANLVMAFIWGGIAKIGILLFTKGFNNTGQALFLMGHVGILINLILMILNFIPIPPLDGSRIVYSLLPTTVGMKYQRLEPFGFIIVLILLLTLGGLIIQPPVLYLRDLILSLFDIQTKLSTLTLTGLIRDFNFAIFI